MEWAFGLSVRVVCFYSDRKYCPLFCIKKERIVEKTRCRALCSMKDFVSLRVIYAVVRGWATAHYGADVENK